MCKAFKTNQSKSLHLKKAGRRLFPPKADGPEGALEKLEFFAYFLVRLRRKTSMNPGNRQSIGRKDFVG
jgi:hypothetical protein